MSISQKVRTDPILDVGGGFAAEAESRRDAKGRPLGTARAPAAQAARIARDARRLFGERTTLLFEPGRALVSGAFHLAARVVRVREGRPPTVYLDASRASHAFFVARGRHPIEIVPRRAGPRRRVVLAGPLGVDLDVFARDAVLPPVRPGDLVVIGSVGAYNQNAANAWAGAMPGVMTAQ
jgi:diaminopimelate decarboxylase